MLYEVITLGDRPRLISRVGDDQPGREVLRAMQGWGMSTAGVQTDGEHPTGQVTVEIVDDEPHYRIVPDCAYDFIAAEAVEPAAGVLQGVHHFFPELCRPLLEDGV